MTLVVLDPGHGGHVPVGDSSPNRALGRTGLREKELALDIALRMNRSTPVGIRTRLTRNRDVNLSLQDRTAVARLHRAQQLVSLHFNSSDDPQMAGLWVIVHERSGAASETLARALLTSLAPSCPPEAHLFRLPMTVLEPEQLPEDCGACLVELGFLSHPPTERRLCRTTYRQLLADRLWSGILEGSRTAYGRRSSRGQPGAPLARPGMGMGIDIYHEVPLVAQTTGMSCWAAAAAMVVGWREAQCIESVDVAARARRLGAFADGLLPSDVQEFARAWNLTSVLAAPLTLSLVADLLTRFGPLWMGEADPGLHVVVLVGLQGDGTENGTQVLINDPWPVGLGERYVLPFRRLVENVEMARRMSGPHVQLLHSAGRPSPTAHAQRGRARPLPRDAGPFGRAQ